MKSLEFPILYKHLISQIFRLLHPILNSSPSQYHSPSFLSSQSLQKSTFNRTASIYNWIGKVTSQYQNSYQPFIESIKFHHYNLVNIKTD